MARRADGLFPILTRPHAESHEYREVQEELRREPDRLNRDTSEIAMLGLTSFRISGSDEEEARRRPRRNLGGTAEQILGTLSALLQQATRSWSWRLSAPLGPTRNSRTSQGGSHAT